MSEHRSESPAGDGLKKAAAALMALAAERDFASVGLADIAEKAGISLAALREVTDGKLTLLEHLSRSVDLAVLAGVRDGNEESRRDRLFDLLMKRFDALAPMKAGMEGLWRSARRDPPLALALHAITLTAMRWMLEAADIPAGGLRRAIRVEGLTVVYIRAVHAWLADDDPDLAKTMAALDSGLRRGEAALERLDKVTEFCRSFMPERGRRRRAADAEVRESEAG